jgi:predicted dienelactone hydrolase
MPAPDAALRDTAFAFVLAIAIVVASPVDAAEQSVRLAGVNVTVWSRDAEAEVKQPVIVFSHGFHGCATQSRFLMEAFSAAGYLVVAPNHRDAACAGGEAHWKDKAQAPFREPEKWSDANYRDRADDVRHLVAALAGDPRFRTRADLSRLALAGHSLGG